MPSPSNKIVIIAAPSGAGKTSVTRHLLRSLPDQLAFSISCATRSPRNNEKDNVDYYFISVDEFKQRINRKEFVEWEMVYAGKYYGTLKSEIERLTALGRNVVFDVDVKGAMSIKHLYPEETLTVFIKVPSMEILEKRLRLRGTDTEESLTRRLTKARGELTFEPQFDVVLINDVLEQTLKEAEDIVQKFLL